MSNEKQEYLLLFRGSDNWYKELSREEFQQIMGKIKAWIDGLVEKGIMKGAQPLGAEGRTVSGKGGRTASDGPFAESKETIGGYMLILAERIDEAGKNAPGGPPPPSPGSVEG